MTSPLHLTANETSFKAGRCITKANFIKVFKAQEIFILDFRNLNLGDYGEDFWDIEKVFFPTYMYYQYKSKLKSEPEWYAMVRTIAELYCPNLPDRCFVNQDEARENVTSVFRSFMTTNELWRYTKLSVQDFRNWAKRNGIATLEEFPLKNSNLAVSLSFETCLMVIQYACHPTSIDPSKSNLIIASAIYFITAVASKELITDESMEKIQTMVNDELGCCIILNHKVVNLLRRELFRHLQKEIDCVKMVEIIPRLVNIKIRLILQKADLESLSHLFRIGSMIKSYPDFPWSQIDVINCHETAQLKKAFEAIQAHMENFIVELGPADPSRYPLFAHTANRLAAEIEGDTILTDLPALPVIYDEKDINNFFDVYKEKLFRHVPVPTNNEQYVKRLIEVIPF